MLTEPTIDKLKDLALHGMAEAFIEQTQRGDLGELGFDDRFSLLVDAEWVARQNRRLERRLREAKLRISGACIEDFEASPARGLDKASLMRLAACSFVPEHMNIIVTGATGTGKTYLACAIAQQACRKGFRANYRRASRLYDELRLARADGTYPKLLARLARIDVLVLDDFGLSTMKDADRQALLDVLEDRYGNRSTIVTSQLPPKAWHDYLGDPTLADSICDRVVHTAHRVTLKGPSRRKKEAKRN